MECKICATTTSPVFQSLVLNKHTVTYFKCPSCGFLQTEKPYWLEEAYKYSINLTDTGIVVRNQRSVRITTAIIRLFFDQRGKFLDYAGGFGLFTRMMRDVGFDFYWSDPYTRNELARGFESVPGDRYTLATSFESFEHFEAPGPDTLKILEKSDNILATTELLPDPVPPRDWWYYGFHHGQHIALYTRDAFAVLARKLDLNYYNADNFHLLTRRRLPLLGRALFKLPRVKYLLYLISFPLSIGIRSKTLTDRHVLKGNQPVNS